MVHNGIEYGLMQSYAEGFDVLRSANDDVLPESRRYAFSLSDIAEVWRRGSVISSWLLDLSAMALLEDPELSTFRGYVEDSGEGQWMINTALEESVPVNGISAAFFARFRSRKEHTFAEKVISALRYKFGGHAEQAVTPLDSAGEAEPSTMQ
jgi:6-phosphogluconate dehydrogenase